MDFFGFSDAPELSTRIGVLVKSGTDPLLLGPDWAKNIEICDHINSHNNGADAVKAILHQLKSSDPKVVALALTMIETCTKNCVSVPQNINRSFMDEMVNISTGRKGFDNQEDALKMIQMWGLSYERRRNELPLFFETYMTLKTRGIRFPEPEDQPTSPQSRGNSDSACAHPLSRSVDMAAGNQSDDSTKLRNDLGVVMEKIRLCREMLPESPGIQQDEILAEVVGFLEACQERMIDLIETGTQGLLAEDVFELCLRVNDALLRTLEAEKSGTPIPVDDDMTTAVGRQTDGGSGKTGGDGAAVPKQLKAVQMDDDEEEDIFSELSTKPAKVVGAPSSVKKVPNLKPPAQSGSSKVLLPPPPSSQQQQVAGAAPAGECGGGEAILDFLSAAPATPPRAAAYDATTSREVDEFDSLFGMSTEPSAGPRPLVAPPAGSSTGMTDDEFENFLNTVGPVNK